MSATKAMAKNVRISAMGHEENAPGAESTTSCAAAEEQTDARESEGASSSSSSMTRWVQEAS